MCIWWGSCPRCGVCVEVRGRFWVVSLFYLVVLGIEVRPLVWAAGIPAGSSAPTEPCHWPLSSRRVYGSRLSGNIVLSQGCGVKRVGCIERRMMRLSSLRNVLLTQLLQTPWMNLRIPVIWEDPRIKRRELNSCLMWWVLPRTVSSPSVLTLPPGSSSAFCEQALASHLTSDRSERFTAKFCMQGFPSCSK